MLNEYEAINNLEVEPVPREHGGYAVVANAIKTDASRLKRSILFLFPEGMICSTIESLTAPTTDIEVDLKLRKHDVQFKVDGNDIKQQHHPFYWRLRVIEAERKLLKNSSKRSKSLTAAFAGMKLSNNNNNMNP